MKETPRRRIPVTPSLKHIQSFLGRNMVVMRGVGVTPSAPPFSAAGFWASGLIYKDDVNGFSTISDICFI
jgi:hypothetical protein